MAIKKIFVMHNDGIVTGKHNPDLAGAFGAGDVREVFHQPGQEVIVVARDYREGQATKAASGGFVHVPSDDLRPSGCDPAMAAKSSALPKRIKSIGTPNAAGF